jgi:hypothetical protein
VTAVSSTKPLSSCRFRILKRINFSSSIKLMEWNVQLFFPFNCFGTLISIAHTLFGVECCKLYYYVDRCKIVSRHDRLRRTKAWNVALRHIVYVNRALRSRMVHSHVLIDPFHVRCNASAHAASGIQSPRYVTQSIIVCYMSHCNTFTSKLLVLACYRLLWSCTYYMECRKKIIIYEEIFTTYKIIQFI